MLRKFNPPNVSASPAYHHGVEATGFQRLLFISGQVGVNPDGSVADGISAQTEAAMKNLKAVLAGADMDVSDIAKFTIYLTDASHTPEVIAAAKPYWPSPSPAVTLLVVKGLASPALLVEIEATAAK